MARSSRPLTRRAGTATEAETIVIVCEGEKTEEIYFNGIRQKYRLSTTRIKFIGLGADPLAVVERAEALKRDYDHAWAVFDVESAFGPAVCPALPPSLCAQSVRSRLSSQTPVAAAPCRIMSQ